MASTVGTASTSGFPVRLGQCFLDPKTMRATIAQELISQGRALKCSNGGGSQKRYHCKTCDAWVVRATKRRDGLWYITSTDKEHMNCSGGGGRSDTIAAAPLVEKYVRLDPKISGPSLKRLLKDDGIEISDRSANRAKRRVTAKTDKEEAEARARFASPCNQMRDGCPGSVAGVEWTQGAPGSPLVEAELLSNACTGANSDARSVRAGDLGVAQASPMTCYALRLRPGEELKSALIAFMSRVGSRAGFVISCVGSVRDVVVRLAGATRRRGLTEKLSSTAVAEATTAATTTASSTSTQPSWSSAPQGTTSSPSKPLSPPSTTQGTASSPSKPSSPSSERRATVTSPSKLSSSPSEVDAPASSTSNSSSAPSKIQGTALTLKPSSTSSEVDAPASPASKSSSAPSETHATASSPPKPSSTPSETHPTSSSTSTSSSAPSESQGTASASKSSSALSETQATASVSKSSHARSETQATASTSKPSPAPPETQFTASTSKSSPPPSTIQATQCLPSISSSPPSRTQIIAPSSLRPSSPPSTSQDTASSPSRSISPPPPTTQATVSSPSRPASPSKPQAAASSPLRHGSSVTAGMLEERTESLEEPLLSTGPDARFEILSLVGTFSPDGAHLHICLGDEAGAVCGGHLINATVHTTAEIVVGEARGLVFSRTLDDRTGFKELVVRERSQSGGAAADS